MSCPDNLLIGYRKGVLGAEDAARLDAHLAQCPTCRLSLRVGEDFDAVLATQAGDELIAARFARNLGGTFVAQRTERHSSRLRFAWVAAAALAIFASVGIAAAAHYGWSLRLFKNESQVETRVPERKPHKPPAQAKVLAPAVSEPVSEPAAPSPSEPEAPRVEGRDANRESAAELFAQANERRRKGELAQAQRLYRALQQRFPRAQEVSVSRVSLGRVQLELGDPRAALLQFSRYLSESARGPLAEEALFGKARALERLRRTGEERRTWDTLLATFPSSIYADQARLRLELLVGSRADPRALQ